MRRSTPCADARLRHGETHGDERARLGRRGAGRARSRGHGPGGRRRTLPAAASSRSPRASSSARGRELHSACGWECDCPRALLRARRSPRRVSTLPRWWRAPGGAGDDRRGREEARAGRRAQGAARTTRGARAWATGRSATACRSRSRRRDPAGRSTRAPPARGFTHSWPTFMDPPNRSSLSTGPDRRGAACSDTIRRCSPRPAEIERIERESYATPWSRSMFAGELSKLSSVCRRLGREEEALVGYLIVSRYVDAWHVMNIAVDPARRRAGPRRDAEPSLRGTPRVTAGAATRSRYESRTRAPSTSTSGRLPAPRDPPRLLHGQPRGRGRLVWRDPVSLDASREADCLVTSRDR